MAGRRFRGNAQIGEWRLNAVRALFLHPIFRIRHDIRVLESRAAVNSRWRLAVPALQVAALVAAAVFLVRFWRAMPHGMGDRGPTVRWPTLILASVIWIASFLQLVELWTRSFAWWGSRIGWLQGVKSFMLSNLARYIPGAVWQFAGMAAMTSAAGASPAAATLGVLLLQFVLLTTGLALTLAFAPNFLGPWAHRLSSAQLFAVAVLLTAGLTAALPRVMPVVDRWAERILKRSLPLPSPPPWAFAMYVFRCAASWWVYGLGFWLFTRALLGAGAPSARVAITAYIASYVAGLLAVFAPGGLGVRELGLVILLRGSLGTDAAAVIALASRLWLVSIELIGSAIVLSIDRLKRPALPPSQPVS